MLGMRDVVEEELGQMRRCPANGSIVAETAKPNGVRIGAYVTGWKNPHPEKPVRSIRAVSAGADAVPIVIGITAER